jgi:hypothetical protein
MKSQVSFQTKRHQAPFMKLNPAVLLAAFSCLVISSCASTQSEKPEPVKSVQEGPKLVGRVASIPADRRFVLIQSYGKWNIESGRILTTRGPDDRTANLRTTGETLGEFAAADLQSGTVEVGDAVYSQHVAKPAELLTTPELSQPQTEALPENVQKNK